MLKDFFEAIPKSFKEVYHVDVGPPKVPAWIHSKRVSIVQKERYETLYTLKFMERKKIEYLEVLVLSPSCFLALNIPIFYHINQIVNLSNELRFLFIVMLLFPWIN